MDFRCIQCGFPMKKLYIQYSPGNTRLLKCENCKVVADEYIECEIMILVLDMVLHKPKAYRHLFFNMFNRETLNFEGLLWKSTIGYLLLDAHRIMVLNRGEEKCSSSASFAPFFWGCGEVLMYVFFGNLMFLCTLVIGTRKLLNAVAGLSWYKDILLAILVSSYFKVFLIAMMVWEFPSSVIFIVDVFVISSNTVALKVVTESALIRCFCVCFTAHAVKFLASGGFNIHPSELVI